jgi:hypothetical protein
MRKDRSIQQFLILFAVITFITMSYASRVPPWERDDVHGFVKLMAFEWLMLPKWFGEWTSGEVFFGGLIVTAGFLLAKCWIVAIVWLGGALLYGESNK